MATESTPPQKWKINKEISFGDIIAFVSAFIAVIYAYTTLDKRISVLEIMQVAASTKNSDQDKDRDLMRAELRVQLNGIEEQIREVRQILIRKQDSKQ